MLIVCLVCIICLVLLFTVSVLLGLSFSFAVSFYLQNLMFSAGLRPVTPMHDSIGYFGTKGSMAEKG